MGIKRRDILKLAAGAAAGAGVGLLASPAPWSLVRDLTRRGQDSPGAPRPPSGPLRELATTSKLCPTGSGILVRMADGRPVGVRGNPAHPLNQGALTPLALAEACSLVAPGRLTGPLRAVGKGRFEPLSWAQALDLLTERLAQAGPRTAAITGDHSGSMPELLGAFLKTLGSTALFAMPSEGAVARRALEFMGGAGQPGFDLDNARAVLILGADALEGLPASLRYRQALAARSDTAWLVHAGPCRDATAAASGRFVPLPAGQEACLALGIAWHLFAGGMARTRAGDAAELKALVEARFAPDQVARATGLGAGTVAGLAAFLARSPAPLVLAGAPGGEGSGAAAHVAALALNVLLDRVGRPGGLYAVADLPGVFPGATAAGDAAGWCLDLALGRAEPPEVLLLHEANPAHALPATSALARGAAKAGFTVAFCPFPDESALAADLILPGPLPLERFDDVATPAGLAFASYGLVRPLVRPAGDVRHPGDVLLGLAARLGRPLGYAAFRQVLAEKAARLERTGGYTTRGVWPWEVLAGRAQPAPEPGLWRNLAAGLCWAGPGLASGPAVSLGAAFLAKAVLPRPMDPGRPVLLSGQASPRAGTPGLGLPVPSATSIRPDELARGVSAIRLNAATARLARVLPGETVRVRSDAGEVRATVVLDETVADGQAVMLLGLGRDIFPEPAGVGGVNARRVMDPWPEEGSGLLTWAATPVGLERV